LKTLHNDFQLEMNFLRFFLFMLSFLFKPILATYSVRVKSLVATSGCDELAPMLEQEIMKMGRMNYTLYKLTVTQNGGSACRAITVFLNPVEDLITLDYGQKSNMALPYIN
jgi:hypothetical protein